MKNFWKKLSILGVTLALMLNVMSCSHPEYYRAQMDKGFSQENWMQQVNLNPNIWTKNADPWYFSADRDLITHQPVFDPVAEEMAAKPIRIPDFTHINVNGNFRIQIVGSQPRTSVTVLGPKQAKRLICIQIRNQTLYIYPAPECKNDKKCPRNFNDVTIRIGIHDLRSLTTNGDSSITGKDIYSSGLAINATNRSQLLLRGNMKLALVNDSGCATTTIIGAVTPCLYINVKGCGTVNVAGRVGVKCIRNLGQGNVNIIGACSHDLSVFGGDTSTTKIAGIANVRRVIAYGHSRIFMYWVNANCAIVKVSDHACVGLAGYTQSLYVDTDTAAVFYGKCLIAGSAFVRTFGLSHVNVTATKKIFASAYDDSSIYYFGSPSIISRFVYGNGIIIPVWTNEIATPPVSQLQSGYFDFRSD
jgi:hypothetical protein